MIRFTKISKGRCATKPTCPRSNRAPTWCSQALPTPPNANRRFHWHPRATFAGTYDNTWRVERRPWYPKDFDFHFYNGAHPDLQAEGYLQGNEPVELVNLTPPGQTPEGTLQFDLPGIRPQCLVRRINTEKPESISMNLDTVFIEPDQSTLCLVWRGATPLAELSEAEIDQVTVGIH